VALKGFVSAPFRSRLQSGLLTLFEMPAGRRKSLDYVGGDFYKIEDDKRPSSAFVKMVGSCFEICIPFTVASFALLLQLRPTR